MDSRDLERSASSISGLIAWEETETPPGMITYGEAEPHQGVRYSEQLGAFISTYIDQETGLESRRYFYPHKNGGFDMARQAAIQYRQDYFLSRLHGRKDNPQAAETLKQLCEERRQAHTLACSMRRSHLTFYGRVEDDLCSSTRKSKPEPIDVEELEDKIRLRRIASAKKLHGMVKPVELPYTPISASTCSNPTSPQGRIIAQVQPFRIFGD